MFAPPFPCLFKLLIHISTCSTWVNLLIISQMKPCLPYKDWHLQRIIILNVSSSISLSTTLTCHAGPRPQPHITKVNKWVEKVPGKSLGLAPVSKRFFQFSVRAEGEGKLGGWQDKLFISIQVTNCCLCEWHTREQCFVFLGTSTSNCKYRKGKYFNSFYLLQLIVLSSWWSGHSYSSELVANIGRFRFAIWHALKNWSV